MTTTAVILVVCVIVAMDVFIFSALFASLRSGLWEPLSRAYPAVEQAPDAIRRQFQSIKIGLFNLGWCVHIAVDDRFLHIEPTRFLRWFRMTKMSIPWDEIQLKRRSRFGGVTLRVRNTTIHGPEWAFGLAQPPDAVPSNGAGPSALH